MGVGGSGRRCARRSPDDAATLRPVTVMRLASADLPALDRGVSHAENLTISLVEVEHADVVDYFEDVIMPAVFAAEDIERLLAPHVTRAWFARLELPSGELFLHSGVGRVVLDGVTWLAR